MMKTDWQYHGRALTTIPDGQLGFVYTITNLINNKFYIGKKLFYFQKRVKVTGKKRCKKTLVESDWKTYYGSSNDLQRDVEKYGKDNFKREIFAVYPTKWDMSYNELRLQLLHDVMNPETFTYNGIINVRLRKRTK